MEVIDREELTDWWYKLEHTNKDISFDICKQLNDIDTNRYRLANEKKSIERLATYIEFSELENQIESAKQNYFYREFALVSRELALCYDKIYNLIKEIDKDIPEEKEKELIDELVKAWRELFPYQKRYLALIYLSKKDTVIEFKDMKNSERLMQTQTESV